jgi:LytS/YehU family sensor histidine kinase
MLDHLIAYLRATLSASQATEHSLQAEFDRLRDYLELMAVRMGPRLAYSLELPEDLQQCSVPPCCCSPGGKLHPPRPGAQGRRRVHPRVRPAPARHPPRSPADHGQRHRRRPGPHRRRHAPAPAKPGRGFGLRQVRERLQTLYGPEARMSLRRGTSAGTEVELRYALRPCPTRSPSIACPP